MQKPVETFLSLFGIAVGIIMTLLPKTFPVVITCLLLIYGLLVYPIWNFWYIERSLWLRLSALFLLASFLCGFGYIVLPKQNSLFKCNVLVAMKFSYPGPVFIVYPSGLGNTMSFPNMALYVEVVNNKPTATRISDYECRMLLSYDEGGITEAIKTSTGGLKYKYKPTGKAIEKWQILRSMGFLGNNVYYVINDNLKKSRRLNFTENSFDRLASNTQLISGQSIKGWIFFEFESSELTFQLPKIKEIELTIHNSAGESEICRIIHDETKPQDNAKNVISAGDWQVEAGEYDFTKEKYTAVRMIDLPNIIKSSTIH